MYRVECRRMIGSSWNSKWGVAAAEHFRPQGVTEITKGETTDEFTLSNFRALKDQVSDNNENYRLVI